MEKNKVWKKKGSNGRGGFKQGDYGMFKKMVIFEERYEGGDGVSYGSIQGKNI